MLMNSEKIYILFTNLWRQFRDCNMGIIISRFRKKKSTLEVLESLEKNIKSIEEYGQTTERQHKAVVGRLVLFSAGLYVMTACLFYFFFFPASLYDQLLYVVPLLLFPLIIIFVKRLVSWWYRRKLSRNQEKLSDMKKQKKELLEEVMDKETYKVAKQILEKFAPDQLRKGSATVGVPRTNVGTVSNQLVLSQRNTVQGMQGFPRGTPGTEVRRRPVGYNVVAPIEQIPQRPVTAVTPRIPSEGTDDPGSLMTRTPLPGVVPRLARPILPRERSVMDRLVEYLVGDGINQRYALICGHCHSHNGMAIKEEFEFLAFRCCYCFHWNPARKRRLQAPRLEALPSSGNTSSSSAAESYTEEDEPESQPTKAVPLLEDENIKSEPRACTSTSSSSDEGHAANADAAESPSSTEAEFESLIPDPPPLTPTVQAEASSH